MNAVCHQLLEVRPINLVLSQPAVVAFIDPELFKVRALLLTGTRLVDSVDETQSVKKNVVFPFFELGVVFIELLAVGSNLLDLSIVDLLLELR